MLGMHPILVSCEDPGLIATAIFDVTPFALAKFPTLYFRTRDLSM